MTAPASPAETQLAADAVPETPVGLSDAEIEATVGQMIDQARHYVIETLEPVRKKATDYYYGRPFGTEESGRSQVVMTPVRDTVRKIMPSLMRIFFGAEHVVQYEPHGPEDEADAQQQTDYARYILTQDNPGYAIFYSAFKDALVRKLGIVKWWWDTERRVETAEYTGLADAQLMSLMLDPAVDLTILRQTTDPATQASATDVRVRRVTRQGRFRLAAVPPEEVYWNPQARSLADARLFGHGRDVRKDELVAMGYPEAELEGLVGKSGLDLANDGTANARRLDQGTYRTTEEQQPEETRPVRYDEVYVYLAVEPADGVQLWKCCFAGDQHKLLHKEPVTDRDFALFCPDPEPHTMDGLCPADLVMDLQEITSDVVRGTLDSLSKAIEPVTEVVEGQVNMTDVLSPERNRVVRSRQPGMMREVAHRFVGADTLPMLDAMRQLQEERTGQPRQGAGATAEDLQSTTKSAVEMLREGSTEQIELIARTFAETGMKAVFEGLRRLLVQHQEEARIVRLRGQFVQMDPRTWNSNMDVRVVVPLGAGLVEDRRAALREIAADQTMILEKYGVNNPLVSLRQARNTRARLVELAGFTSAEEFYLPITPQQEQALQQQAAANPPPQGDPAQMALAQAEVLKAQTQAEQAKADTMLRQQELALKERQMVLDDERAKEQAAANLAIQVAEIEARYATQIDRAKLNHDTAILRSAIDAQTRTKVATIQHQDHGPRPD
jgi:hypothetical protein